MWPPTLTKYRVSSGWIIRNRTKTPDSAECAIERDVSIAQQIRMRGFIRREYVEDAVRIDWKSQRKIFESGAISILIAARYGSLGGSYLLLMAMAHDHANYTL